MTSLFPKDEGKTNRGGTIPDREHPPARTVRRELDSLSDDELAAVFVAGEHDAMKVLFKRYSGLVFGIARRRLRDDGEAEETVQEVFRDIYRAIDQFDPRKGTFRSWLLQFAYHRSINRKEYLESRRFYDWTEIEGATQVEIVEGARRPFQMSPQEIGLLTNELLAGLDPRQRRVMELTYYEGFTAEEIASKTGESASAVRHMLYRGFAKLRSALLGDRHVAEKAGKKDDAPEKGICVAYPRSL